MITNVASGAGQRDAAAGSLPTTRMKTGPSFDDVLTSFKKEAQMTTRERVRRDILAANKLTEEALAAMPPAEREAIEKKLAPIIARRIEAIEEAARRTGRPGASALL